LNLYVREHRPWLLYLLPVVQVAWINAHPSAVLAAVPFGAVLVGGALQRSLQRRGWAPLPYTPTGAQLRTIAIVALGLGAGSFLTPYGYRPLLLPIELLQSSFLMEHIDELQPPTFHAFPLFFVMVALVALTFAATARRLSLVALLLVVPFAYQALTSVRFMFLFGLVAAPILIRNLADIVGRWSPSYPRRPLTVAVQFTAVCGTIVVALALTRLVPLLDPRRAPGFGVNWQYVPEGALRYLDRVGVDGRLYNTFSMGGYIEWRDFPRRVPIIDGRGYLPADLFEEVHHARA